MRRGNNSRNAATTIGVLTALSGWISFTRTSLRLSRRSIALVARQISFVLLVLATVQLKAAPTNFTTTTLTVAPGSSVVAGTVVTMVASVVNPNPVSKGIVEFCDASRVSCLPGGGLYGTAQLTPNGTATLRTRFGTGTSAIVAVFLPTNINSGSKSSTVSVTVNAIQIEPSATTLSATGVPGNYTLSGDIVAFGRQPLNGPVNLLDTTAGNSQISSALLSNRRFVFSDSIPYLEGAEPASVAIGDFNGDGFQDMATANISDNTVSVLLGNGDGTFGPPLKLQTGRSPESIVVGDFNGDGVADLAVVNTVDNDLSIFIGNGDGTFQPQMVAGVGRGPISIIVGDFNCDGMADLAVANNQDSDISVLIGNGDGTFEAEVNFGVGLSPHNLVSADFNGDGVADIAVANTYGNTISILLGRGDGTFLNQVTIPESNPYNIAVGDFNGDGTADLVVINWISNSASLLIGNGDGSFRSGISLQTGYSPTSVTIGDLNGDGIQDLVVTNQLGSSITVFLGYGDGTFQPQASYSAGSFPLSAAIGDFNGDGIPDLAYTEAESLDVQLGQQVANFVFNGVSVPGKGNVSVIAVYAGDSLRITSQSSPVTLATTPAVAAISLTSTSNPALVGSPVTFGAVLTGVSGISPTGQVVFKDDSVVIGTGTVVGGIATITTSTLAVGIHSIVASYPGDSNYGGSDSTPYSQSVKIQSVMTITSSLNPAIYGNDIVFTTQMQPGATGTVTFFDGSQTLGQSTVNPSGTATFSIGTLWAGSHTITAIYSGDTNYF